jgi:hypothetical protein
MYHKQINILVNISETLEFNVLRIFYLKGPVFRYTQFCIHWLVLNTDLYVSRI